jgi:hypothetical protein
VDSTFNILDDKTMIKTENKTENISENIIKNEDIIEGDDPVVNSINRVNGNHINHNNIDNKHDNDLKLDMDIMGTNIIVSTDTYEKVNNADEQAVMVTDTTAAVLTEEATDGTC